MFIVKHDGRREAFNKPKIDRAIQLAQDSVDDDNIAVRIVVANEIEKDIFVLAPSEMAEVDVDWVHGAVERKLMKYQPEVAKAYILYRQRRTEYREAKSPLNAEIEKLYTTINKDNANAANGSAASKMYSVAEAATKRYNLAHMFPKHARNHKNKRIYIHDLGYYGITFNCFFNPLSDMLKNGFNNGVGYLRSPKRIGTAVQLACIILQSAQNSMFGGQGFLNFDTDLAPYVAKEFKWQRERLGLDEMKRTGFYPNNDKINDRALERTENAVFQAMEAFVANMNTMRSRSGAQVTFSSVNFGTDTDPYARMISKNLFKAYIDGLGHHENPIFPNLCYRVKEGINLNPGDPNYDITELAVECVGKRIQPRFVFCDSRAYNGMPLEHIGTMGCRTAVRSNINGDPSPDARGNLAFNTINLPMLALEADGDVEKFMNVILPEALDDATFELLERYNVICNLQVKDIPFISEWYQGHEGLQQTDKIEPMVKNGSLSVGFIGLAECLVALIGKHHGESEEAQKLGLKIIGMFRAHTEEWSAKHHLNFSTFATPAESACYTLLKGVRDRFGIVPGVSDKEYLTNSFHLPVGFECDAKKKIDTEAPYHLLCNAGAIFYIEAGGSPKWNPEGIMDLVRYMDKSGIVYGGINWEHDYCMDCGYQGTFDGACPKCGSEKIKETKIVTGYLSESFRFNPGKQAEAADRKSHCGGAFGLE